MFRMHQGAPDAENANADAIASQYKKMNTEAKTVDQKMKDLKDPREIEDVKQ